MSVFIHTGFTSLVRFAVTAMTLVIHSMIKKNLYATLVPESGIYAMLKLLHPKVKCGM